MLRALTALGLLTALTATATAQPGRLPLAPGVTPGSSIGPGTQFLPQPTPRFVPGRGGQSAEASVAQRFGRAQACEQRTQI